MRDPVSATLDRAGRDARSKSALRKVSIEAARSGSFDTAPVKPSLLKRTKSVSAAVPNDVKAKGMLSRRKTMTAAGAAAATKEGISPADSDATVLDTVGCASTESTAGSITSSNSGPSNKPDCRAFARIDVARYHGSGSPVSGSSMSCLAQHMQRQESEKKSRRASMRLESSEAPFNDDTASVAASDTHILTKSLRSLNIYGEASDDDEDSAADDDEIEHVLEAEELKPAVASVPKPLRAEDVLVIKPIGSGALSRVMLARRAQSKSLLAVKRMAKSLVVERKQVAHVMSEKRLLKRVSSPFFLELFAAFQDPSYLYLVTEFCAGGDLWHQLKQSQRFSEEATRFYAGQIALAINHIHNQNIIYRDLKLENVLLDAQGNVKIADFGFAKEVHDLTSTFCGTPDYMAAEIIQGKEYDRTVDWFAFGVLVHELLSGVGPFSVPGHDELLTYENIVQNKLTWSKHVSTIARALIKGLVAQKPAARYAFAEIKFHKFFAGTDWELLAAREVQPPFTPTQNTEAIADQPTLPLSAAMRLEMGKTDPFENYFADF